MKRLALLLATLLLAMTGASVTVAHECAPPISRSTRQRPATMPSRGEQPVVGELALHLVPHLSGGWLEQRPSSTYATPFYLIKIWRIESRAPLAGQTLSVEGLDRSITDVLVRANGGIQEATSGNPAARCVEPGLRILRRHGGWRSAHLACLGIEHILTGPDHLSFVLGLMLLVGLRWRLIKAITAFTVAHSITLASAALGLVHFPSAVIEALVAMSILFLASELIRARQGEDSLTVRYPWLIAFTFGLLHGLAFAGALADVGLPPNAIPESACSCSTSASNSVVLGCSSAQPRSR